MPGNQRDVGGLIADLKLGLGALSGMMRRSSELRSCPTRTGSPALHAFAWMVPGELALFSLDELERAKEWAAG